MSLLNPSNAATYTLTFTRIAAANTGTDALGNSIASQTAVTVQAILTPLGIDKVPALAPRLGVTKRSYPFKVRVESWPSALISEEIAVASLTYNRRPATITLGLSIDQNPHAAKLVPDIGVSCEGLLVYT